MKNIYILIIIISLFAPNIFGRVYNDLKFNHIGISQGLSHATVSAIAQDSLGYMWIATPDGLNRYDGYSFRVYRHNPDNPNSIASNLLKRIEFDKKGNLWVSGENHISEYDFSTESFKNFFPKDNITISDIYPVDDNTILVGTSEG